MNPIETTKRALEFAGPAAPGWLLLLIPAALLLVWRLYRLQFKDIARVSKICLLALRCLLLAGILLLIFRPVIVSRKTLTYPGRIMLVVDDSESMLANDNRLAHGEALYIARRLNSEAADAHAEYHQAAEILRRVFQQMKDFQTYSRGADRASDDFWVEAERIESQLGEMFEQAVELLHEASGGVPTQNDRRIEASLGQSQETAATFFEGERHPGHQRFDDFFERLAATRTMLLNRQAEIDGARLAETATRSALSAVRTRRRSGLLAEALADSLPAAKHHAGNQFVMLVSLMTGKTHLLENSAELPELPAVRGETAIINPLLQLVEEENSFPLTAIVLFSDGRDLAGGNGDNLKQALARRNIPLFSAGIGGETEPYDLAVAGIDAAPFAVEGRTLPINANLKTVLPEPAAVQMNLLHDGEIVAGKEILVGEDETQSVEISFVPKQQGTGRYSVALQTASSEVFPRRNNIAHCAIDVREQPVRVIMLDYKPRWETRFAGTVLRNLDYIELNQIILAAQPGLKLNRGVGRGLWPDSFDALNMYDLLILGDMPDGFLSEKELDNIRRFVTEAGKAICFFAPESDVARSLMAEFLPPHTPPVPDDRNLQLAATEAGTLHPATYMYEGDAETLTLDASVFAPDTQVLAVNKETRLPFITARFAGGGRAVRVAGEYLWRANHRQYDAHRSTYIQMVTWAIQARRYISDGEEKSGTALAVDAGVFNNRRGFQVWLYGGSTDATIAMHAGEDIIDRIQAEPHFEGTAISRAAFFNPQQGEESETPAVVHFELEGQPDVRTGDITVIDDYRELNYLAQDTALLQKLAEQTGGKYRSFVDFEDFFHLMEAKTRIEEFESRWKVWDSTTILWMMAGLLAIQWVWRKIVGLV